MTAHTPEDYKGPCQLERLLEVPVKFILIEDLIKEKIALGERDCLQSPGLESPQEIDEEGENRENTTPKHSSGKRPCFFNCCTNPSRWKDTDLFSHTSKCRTKSIKLPWIDSLAVIPVLQSGPRSSLSSSCQDASTNEDDTDVDMINKNSEEEKVSETEETLDGKETPSSEKDTIANADKGPAKITKETLQIGQTRGDIINSTPEDKDKNPVADSRKSVPSVTPSPSGSPVIVPTVVAAFSGSGSKLDKVTEKPTRFEDFLNAHCGESSNATDKDPESITIIQGCDDSKKNDSDDTLKLTFYNEGIKETTKEFRTSCPEPEASTPVSMPSPSLEVCLLQNQLGLQMTRVIRGTGSDDSLKAQQNVGVMDTGESGRSEDNQNNDNTQASSKATSNATNGSDKILSSPSPIFKHYRQLRLSSSSVEKSSRESTPGNGSVTGNDGRGSFHQLQHGKQRDGLQISRCQKDVVMPDGEGSNSSTSNRGITGESSHATTSSNVTNPPENDSMGESENSLEIHLQSYLTSLRYVKPTDSGSSDKALDNSESKSSKGKSPISPRVGPSTNNIISPVISPRICSPAVGIGSGAGTVVSPGGVRMGNLQRSSPSHQHQGALLDSWAERTIARIPTRPVLKKTYDQQIVVPPPVPFHQTVQQHQRLISPTVQSSTPTSNIGSTTTFPLHSPPKRFKSNSNPIVAQQPSVQQHQYQQQQLSYIQGNKQPSVSASAQLNRNTNVSHLTQNQVPYQHQISHCTNTSKVSNTAQQSHQVYNQQGYNQRPSMQQQGSSVSSNVQMMPQVQQHSNLNTGSQNYQHQTQAQHSQYQTTAKHQTNSANATQAHYHQQQLQFHRHLQESLLIASTALASSTDPVDSSYESRLKRYSEYYQRQELDIAKLQDYHKKYGFYPWDILTARDESILRYMRVSQDQNQQEQQQQYPVSQNNISRGTEGYRSSSNVNERYNMQSHTQNQQQHYNARITNTVQNASRVMPEYSSSQQAMPNLPTVLPGNNSNAGTGAGLLVNKNIASVSQSVTSRAVSQNRYPVNSQQVLQHREYIAQQQQRINSKVFQEQTEFQYYRQAQNQHQSQLQSRDANCGNLVATFDTHTANQYNRSSCQLPTGPSPPQSMGSITTGVPLHQSRSNDMRITTNTMSPGRDRVAQILHSQSSSGSRPIVMTVSDPVPAPPEAIPLSIHRQALEQAIKSNQTGHNSQYFNDPYGLTSLIRDDLPYRRDQGRPQTTVNPQMSIHQGVGIQGKTPSNQAYTKEPLTVASSPTLAQQTSVIRRIQNTHHESPSSMASGTSTHPRTNLNDRAGVSFRRISGGTGGTDSITSGKQNNPSAFSYRTSKEATPVITPVQAQYQQQQYYSYANTNTTHGITTGTPIRHPDNIAQGYLPRGPGKRRIIITDNNGVNQNIPDRCTGVVASPTQLMATEKEVITANVSPSSVLATMSETMLDNDEDRGDALGGPGWQYDHVVLLDKRIKTYMCKRCFETLKTEQQIRNHLFCKMLANHVQCHVCQQLVNAEVYPSHLQIHGVRPPDSLEMHNE